jgi:hypothetical protein
MVDSVAEAMFVRDQSTDWYNAEYSTPEHGMEWKPGDLEIVVFEIVVKTKIIEEN